MVETIFQLAPKPYVTDLFHPLASKRINNSFPFIYQGVSVISSKRCAKVCLGNGRYLTIAHGIS